MKKCIYFLVLVCCMRNMQTFENDDDFSDEAALDQEYKEFYIDPLSGKKSKDFEKEIQNVFVHSDQTLQEQNLKLDPEYYIEEAKIEMDDIAQSQRQNLPAFLIVREAIEAAEQYEMAGQVFLDKNDTQQAIKMYQQALQIYLDAQKLSKAKLEKQEIKHAIRSAKYTINELGSPQKQKKSLKNKNKKIKGKVKDGNE